MIKVEMFNKRTLYFDPNTIIALGGDFFCQIIKPSKPKLIKLPPIHSGGGLVLCLSLGGWATEIPDALGITDVLLVPPPITNTRTKRSWGRFY